MSAPAGPAVDPSPERAPDADDADAAAGPALPGAPGRGVDWDLAERTALRWTAPGPVVSLEEAHEVVGRLREHALAATEHVTTLSRLDVPAGAPALVVDRPGWLRANLASFRALVGPALDDAARRRREREPEDGPLGLGRLARAARAAGPLREDGPAARGAAVLTAGATGAELGGLLTFLAPRVLGQYDVFRPGGGRLLLVAPNIVAVERELRADPDDFRLWVALHEETHRVQFAAAPWLADHLAARARALVGEVLDGDRGPSGGSGGDAGGGGGHGGGRAGSPGGLGAVLSGRLAARRAPAGGAGREGGLAAALAGPEQRRAVAEVTAVMSLLEGHADVVMDAAGPAVIPSVRRIRRAFQRRRTRGRGTVDRLLRRTLGLDAKLAQYRDGARFVRAVQRSAGVDGFNLVWSGPDLLPTPEEVAAPALWLRRVHG